MFLPNGKIVLATVVCLLFAESGMAQSREVDYSRIKASPRVRPVTALLADSGRNAKPSILTVKAFAVDISKPMASAVAQITSRATGKTQQFALANGRLERVFNTPDVLAIEVSGEGYTTVFRSMTIAVSSAGNRYEFDAQLDPAPIKLTVWAVDSRTNKVIHDAHFTISGKAGRTTLLLTPDSATGLVKTDLPGRGIYQLTSSATGYGDFTKSIRLDSVQSEARVMLTPKKAPDVAQAQALPEAVVKSAKTAYVETPAAKPALKVPVLPSNVQMPAVTNRPFGPIEKGKAIPLKNIYFDQSSPVLRPESNAELDQLAEVLNANPSMQIELRGHTDNQGDFDLNVKLSRDRCQAVIDYLVNKGIAKSRLKAVGRGPIDSIAPNTNEENRKKNRRVEFVVI
ncbi:OmpA family protein [Spirosoma sp. KCTC 42546]|nr:OmpA family protein [Spirosoma sp. KCTC 42546]